LPSSCSSISHDQAEHTPGAHGRGSAFCRGVSRAFEEGDELELNYDASLVRNLTRGTEVKGTPLPAELVRIVAAGGMMQLLKEEAGVAR